MKWIKKRFRIGGMTCVNCENRIERKLRRTAGVKEVQADYNTGTVRIAFDPDLISFRDITSVIEKLGYEVLTEEQAEQTKISRTVSLLVIIIALYMILQRSGVLNRLVPGQLADSKMGYGMLFLTGMLTSVHCIAMCGGINLSQCIPRTAEGNDSRYSAYIPTFLYNLGRVISYTVIGFILGAVGMAAGGASGTGISVFVQGVIKLLAGAFMVIMGISMLGIFPWLRRFQLRMPKIFAVKIGKKKAAGSQPFVVGLLNGLMPCGPLQAMQLVALASGSPIAGACSMLAFSLGTVPLMLGLGSIVSALGKRYTKAVMSVGAVLVVVLGLAMISQGRSLSGIFVGYPAGSQAEEEAAGEIADGVQVVNSTLIPGSYPDITVQAGTPVKWVINAPEGSINGCNYKMIIPDYGIEYAFEEGENVIEFTPTESGTVPYSCWMGMIRANIFVVDGSDGSNASGGSNVSNTSNGSDIRSGESVYGTAGAQTSVLRSTESGSSCCGSGTAVETESSCCAPAVESSCCN